MIGAAEGLTIEFDHDGFFGKPKGVEQSSHGWLAVEVVCFSVESDLHRGGPGMGQAGARISLSQSFQTGSSPVSRSWWAMVAAERSSSISNCGVALLWLQPATRSAGSSSTLRPLTVRCRSSVPAPV